MRLVSGTAARQSVSLERLPVGLHVRRLTWPFVALTSVLAMACAQPDSHEQEARAHAPPPGLEYEPPPPGTYSLPSIQPAVDGTVVDADGTERQLFDYMGDKQVLLSFVYTNCTNARGCPRATAIFQMLEHELAAESDVADHVRLITLSFDPTRDTAEVMREYAARDHLGVPRNYLDSRWDARPWVFLTTASWTELDPILEGYGQYVVREIDETGNLTGDFSHILKVFLIDRQRRVRNIYSSSFVHPTIAINDLKTLLMDDVGPS